MLNIHDLEQRWLRYKIKSYIPYIVLVLTLIFLATALYFFLYQNNTIKKETIQNQKPKESIANTTQNQTKSTINKNTPIADKTPVAIKTTPAHEENRLLKPSMGFLQEIQQEKRPYKTPKSTPLKPYKKEPTKVKKEKIEKEKKRSYVTKEPRVQEEYLDLSNTDTEVADVVVEEPVQITIERRESQNDIKEVIKRFQKNNNPALSLFVAKKYYELGNYKQAYNYALVTNKINNDIEESWLIFAKSLVKLGRRDQAMKTLREYIKFSHSANAKVLLDEIQRGKFQ